MSSGAVDGRRRRAYSPMSRPAAARRWLSPIAVALTISRSYSVLDRRCGPPASSGASSSGSLGRDPRQQHMKNSVQRTSHETTTMVTCTTTGSDHTVSGATTSMAADTRGDEVPAKMSARPIARRLHPNTVSCRSPSGGPFRYRKMKEPVAMTAQKAANHTQYVSARESTVDHSDVQPVIAAEMATAAAPPLLPPPTRETMKKSAMKMEPSVMTDTPVP
mmetsp:Transcript_20457/g.72348  ORF Transcript_20457/g.72348 Transcript_20457/m.72348 type:complete len:219 (-) Transcript_20457:463-1119(-)